MVSVLLIEDNFSRNSRNSLLKLVCCSVSISIILSSFLFVSICDIFDLLITSGWSLDDAEADLVFFDVAVFGVPEPGILVRAKSCLQLSSSTIVKPSIMGKRRNRSANIENISPELRTSATRNLIGNMKTRSGKATASSEEGETSTSSSSKVITEEIEYPAVQLIQDLATSASVTVTASASATSDGSLSQPNKSPLAESSINEQTPEKSNSTTQVINELLKEAGQITNTTPTANLKILCEEADHDESGTSDQSQEVRTRTDPVTPTANLKMLITAASPEIRSLELSKSRLFEEDEDEDDDDDDDLDEGEKKIGRASCRERV